MTGPAPAAPAVAMPRFRRGQKLACSFDEDELTLAWDAVRAAGLAPGSRVAVEGIELPAWWTKGTGLAPDPAAPLRLRVLSTRVGPAAAVSADAADVDAQAERLHAAAPERKEPEWQGHRLARDGPDTEADFPLGAHVAAARHEDVLAQRMAMPGGTVESWTAIGPGAAPTEFARLQQAVGTYHVVLVVLADRRRTVGLWAGETPPATGQKVRPVLRRLYRQQGAWRHGVKFAPA